MSLASYDGLKAAVAEWLARDDLSDRIPDFIDLAQASLNRRLRLVAQEAQAITTSAETAFALPADFVQLRGLYLDADPDHPLDYVSYRQLLPESKGRPRRFTLTGQSLKVSPAPDTEYTYVIDYWARFPLISTDAQTNWLTDNAPDVLLYASLLETAPYLMDDERLPVWGRLLETRIAALELADSGRNQAPIRSRI